LYYLVVSNKASKNNKYAVYEQSHKREKHKISKLKRLLKSHPNNQQIHKAIQKYKIAVGMLQ